MTKLLLDFPWGLEAALDDPDVGVALERFRNLLGRTQLDPVKFIDDADLSNFYQNYGNRLQGNRNYPALDRFLRRCRRSAVSNCETTVGPPPQNITAPWRRGLRDEIGQSNDWRTPQIVVTANRISDWSQGNHTVVANSLPCQGQATPAPRVLALVHLDAYESHPYSLADLDPWDVRCTAPQGPKPCYLPNPLILDQDPCKDYLRRVPVHDLPAKIALARSRGCRFSEGYFYFIPPDDWHPNAVNSARWRSGHAFERRKAPDHAQVGPIDYQGHVWTWDEPERHWDVQHGGDQKVSVNHRGIILKSSLRR